MKTKKDMWALIEARLGESFAGLPHEVTSILLLSARAAFDLGWSGGQLDGAESMALVVDNAITPKGERRQA